MVRRDGVDPVVVDDATFPGRWLVEDHDERTRRRRRRQRRRRRDRVVTVVIAFVFVLALFRAVSDRNGTSPQALPFLNETPAPAPAIPGVAAGPQEASGPSAPATGSTTPPTAAITSPSTPPTIYSAPAGNYVFLQKNDNGSPRRWDPCREIFYEVHLDGAPPGALEFVQEGLRRLRLVTGLRFTYLGETSQIRQMSDRATIDEPVWIGFAHISDSDIFDGDTEATVAGRGGFDGMTSLSDGGASPTSGEVVLVLPVYGPLVYGPGWSYGNAFLHELGHLVGLTHTAGAGDLMNVTDGAARPDGYGPGDVLGLAQLGSAPGCLPARFAEHAPPR